MNAEEFKSLLKRRPFTPLRIFLTDGTTYDITHPDLVLVSRTRLDIGIPADPAGDLVERVDYVSLLHVVRVEDLQSLSAPPAA